MRTLPRHSGRPTPAALLSVAALVLLAIAIGAGPSVASASAAPKVCNEAGITRSVVRKAFGPTARIGGEGVSESGRCPIESSVNDRPPTECNDEQNPDCVNTEVILGPASEFKAAVGAEYDELAEYGRAKRTPIAGAGPGAVLLTSSEYAEVVSPVVMFEAGRKFVTIVGPRAGEGETARVYRQWEALARAIHAHLS